MIIKFKNEEINPRDYGLELSKVNLHNPKAKTHFVDVPFMDGSHDLTEASGMKLSFYDREAELIFTKIARTEEEQRRIEEFNSMLTGQRIEILLDDETILKGRIDIEKTKEGKYNELKMNGIFNPYREDRFGASEDWLWNPFRFSDGIIYPEKNIKINGITTLYVPARKDNTVLEIESDSIMEMYFNNTKYHIGIGYNRMSEVVFSAGDNKLIFKGNGTISLKYKGRRI